MGYFSKKHINGKDYYYLQYRLQNKITSVYIKNETVNKTKKELALRKKYESEISGIEKRLAELKEAVKLLDSSYIRKLDMLELCSGMDKITQSTKNKCITFADAMTSIEGVPISKTTEEDLNNWFSGKTTYISVFENTLKRYGFSVEVE